MLMPLKLMHVFIDFPLLNLSFLSCHGLVGGEECLFLTKWSGQPYSIISSESYASPCFPSVSHVTDVVLAARHKQRQERRRKTWRRRI